MSDDTNQNVGTVITYDSPHALAAAKAYTEQIKNQLGHKLKNRPSTANEQRRDKIGTELLAATLGKRSLPQNPAASFPVGSAPSTDTTTDPFLKKSGAPYLGWHRTSPVNMSSALDDDAWVRGAYRSLLGREADDTGLAYWKGDLAGGQTREQVVANMKRHPEYRNKFISEAYKNLLGRDVGPEGKDYWGKALKSGESEDSVIANIKRSDEYGRKQQNEMRDLINPKTASQLLNETYNDIIATKGRDYQTALDRVQKDMGTAQDHAALLTTSPTIYTQDPEASPIASLNYLATSPKDSPGIWTKALGDAGKKALANVDISALVDSFINSLS